MAPSNKVNVSAGPTVQRMGSKERHAARVAELSLSATDFFVDLCQIRERTPFLHSDIHQHLRILLDFGGERVAHPGVAAQPTVHNGHDRRREDLVSERVGGALLPRLPLHRPRAARRMCAASTGPGGSAGRLG